MYKKWENNGLANNKKSNKTTTQQEVQKIYHNKNTKHKRKNESIIEIILLNDFPFNKNLQNYVLINSEPISWSWCLMAQSNNIDIIYE